MLDQWIAAFMDELQLKLHTGTFCFLNEKDRNNWTKLKLTEGTGWGGEPGADLLADNLKPAKFTLYTNNTRAEIMKDKLKPNPEGEIEVYKPYWKVKTRNRSQPDRSTVHGHCKRLCRRSTIGSRQHE